MLEYENVLVSEIKEYPEPLLDILAQENLQNPEIINTLLEHKVTQVYFLASKRIA